jgi:hypothetical protein
MYPANHEELAWQFDLSESLFEFDREVLEESASIPAGFISDIRAAAILGDGTAPTWLASSPHRLPQTHKYHRNQ